MDIKKIERRHKEEDHLHKNQQKSSEIQFYTAKHVQGLSAGSKHLPVICYFQIKLQKLREIKTKHKIKKTLQKIE